MLRKVAPIRTVGTSSAPSLTERTTAAASASSQMSTDLNGIRANPSSARSLMLNGQPGRVYSTHLGHVTRLAAHAGRTSRSACQGKVRQLQAALAVAQQRRGHHDGGDVERAVDVRVAVGVAGDGVDLQRHRQPALVDRQQHEGLRTSA